MSERIQGGVNEPRRHDSAIRHVSGEAAYIDDLPEPAGSSRSISASARRRTRASGASTLSPSAPQRVWCWY